MHTPSLEEFELEDVPSNEAISDEELAEQAMQSTESHDTPELEVTVVSSSEDESSDSPLIQRLDLLISLIQEQLSTTSVNPAQSASKQFAKAVQFVKEDKNHYLGAKWFRKAAMQGHAKAQLYLGLMFLKGEGLPKSFFHAYSWLSIAACQNVKEANEAIKKLEPHLTAKETKAALKHAANLMESILAQ